MSLMFLLCLFLLLPCRNSFASFRVRHEITNRSGVLTSAPNAVDKQIAFFLKTHRLSSLEDYAAWAAGHISYQNDFPNDQWADPLKTLQRKYGDCEDIAFLNAAVALVLGYEPEIYILIKKGKAHAICVVPMSSDAVWFDNTNYRRAPIQNSAQLVRALQKEYGYTVARKIDYRDDPWRTPAKSSVITVANK